MDGNSGGVGMNERDEVGELLRAFAEGDKAGEERLFTMLYPELHGIAMRVVGPRGRNHTLQPTALVGEAYLRIYHSACVSWESRAHFLAFAAKAIRHVLIDYARRKNAGKRRAAGERVPVERVWVTWESRAISVLDLDEALETLATRDERAARVVELRFFGGLSTSEIASYLRQSTRTVERDWEFANAWLQLRLS